MTKEALEGGGGWGLGRHWAAGTSAASPDQSISLAISNAAHPGWHVFHRGCCHLLRRACQGPRETPTPCCQCANIVLRHRRLAHSHAHGYAWGFVTVALLIGWASNVIVAFPCFQENTPSADVPTRKACTKARFESANDVGGDGGRGIPEVCCVMQHTARSIKACVGAPARGSAGEQLQGA